MPDTPEYLAARLRSEGEKTARFFRDLPFDTWSHSIYSEGEQWNVLQIMAHLTGAESGIADLIRNIVSGGEGSPEDFDLNTYNQRRVNKMAAQTMEELIVEFTRRRESSAVLVEGLTAEDLKCVGRHPWFGKTSVEEIIKILYRHNQIHQREIRKALTPE